MNGFSTEEDSREGPPAAPAAAPGYGQSCCLIEDGERCVRPAGNASFSKRVQKSISQKKLKLDIDKSVRHLYICDFHKNFIQSVRNKRKRKTSDDGGDSPEHDTDIPEVDLFQLQVNTLRRYKRHYKLQTRPGFNKAQLAEDNCLVQGGWQERKLTLGASPIEIGCPDPEWLLHGNHRKALSHYDNKIHKLGKGL
ncbi:PREDICTED: histone deacetylase complex subunit SAP30L isoform X1 [Hipposideros armiger]|uniref:Histone deacetylase complex subunit SAP30L n=1 Tax=Hipposideros armiger TaxID=186990 RepID=A0A8B7SIT7_HIPAR|nr:PREDICTED: histone deacetylase complex subunit SAP30L isoform X1 [Hipposideros armiger]